jgi:hypothetical protein
MLVNLMLKTCLATEWYPNAQVGDVIKLNERDIELAQTMVHDEDLIKYGDIYCVVEYILDGTIIGALCQEANIEIKMGLIDPGDYRVVGER